MSAYSVSMILLLSRLILKSDITTLRSRMYFYYVSTIYFIISLRVRGSFIKLRRLVLIDLALKYLWILMMAFSFRLYVD